MTDVNALPISALQKSAPGSNHRCTTRRFSAKSPKKSAISVHAFDVFSQPHRRFYFDTPYTSNASNSAPALALSYLLLVQVPPLSLYCSFLLALTVLLCFSLPRRDVCFFSYNFLSRKSSLLFQHLSVVFLC